MCCCHLQAFKKKAWTILIATYGTWKQNGEYITSLGEGELIKWPTKQGMLVFRLHSSMLMHSQVPGWTHLRVQLCVVAESWDLEGTLDFQHYRGVEGRARSPGIRLGRRTRGSSLNLHPKQTTKWLVHIREHLWVLGQATGTLTHKTHHGPDSGEATTFPPYSILCNAPRGLHPNGSFSRDSQVGVPKLSRNSPGWSFGTLSAHNSRLQSLIAMRSKPKL